MLGTVLLVLLTVAIATGWIVGGRSWSDRADVSAAGLATMVGLLGVVVATAAVVAASRAEELATALPFAVAPLLPTMVPLLVRRPLKVAAAVTILCAALLLTYAVVTGLSIGLFFAPAALALAFLATARLRRLPRLTPHPPA